MMFFFYDNVCDLDEFIFELEFMFLWRNLDLYMDDID